MNDEALDDEEVPHLELLPVDKDALRWLVGRAVTIGKFEGFEDELTDFIDNYLTELDYGEDKEDEVISHLARLRWSFQDVMQRRQNAKSLREAKKRIAEGRNRAQYPTPQELAFRR